jgi:hypothetical protein
MITPTQEDFETCQEVLEFILKHTVDNEPHARNYIENIETTLSETSFDESDYS